jgi:hypothetical protein
MNILAYVVVERETEFAQRTYELKEMKLSCVNGVFFHKVFPSKELAEKFVKKNKKKGQSYFICPVEIDNGQGA